ncbi:1,4-dihydroxy-2-naphthoyl-CoA synthase [Streptomyces badius]
MTDEQANTVLYDVSEGLATITLNRPDAMNALNTAAKVALRDALLEASADSAVRAVLLTATGRAFCVGQDLKEHVATLMATREAGDGNALSTVREHYNPIVRAITDDDVDEPDILRVTVGLAERAVELGVRTDGIMIDPGHDFGKNTRHSLEATRRLEEMAETGWPVLVSLSNKDFVGETLDRPVKERVIGTLATTAVSAWLGARVYRVHEVAETRQVLDMVASIAGHRAPAVARRGLA